MYSFLLNLVITFTIIYLWQRFFPCRRVYVNDEGWKPIETLPEKVSERILLTDGHLVQGASVLEFNRKGECTFGLRDNIATHWRYYPLPPK